MPTIVEKMRYLAPDYPITMAGGVKVNLRLIEPVSAVLLRNGWTVVGGAAAPVGVYANLYGEVQMRGRIEGGTFADATVLLVLPVGYRPPYELAILCSRGAGVAWTAKIAANGEVACHGLLSSVDVSLDNIRFRSA